ncbi:hypothetical protein Rhal01_03637 [Rubritalea halochordaticola]|uniref:SLA1 homology domain-containing protein n=1 Tax=Rubritalea halochordaticola TaxID=714537 RepID=A0ABP9V461_9BACT
MSLRKLLPITLLLPAILINSSCMEEDPKKKARLAEKEAIRERRRLAREQANKEYAAEQERLAAERAAEAKAREEEAKAQAEAERLAEEERLRELAEIEAQEKAEAEREAQRVAACKSYKGTKLKKLVLNDGTEYNDVKVTSADAIGVSIMYEHGLKRIPFTNLPEDIRERCHYDPDAAARRKKLEAKRIANQYAKVHAIEASKSNRPQSSSSEDSSYSRPSSDDTKKKKIIPRGSISVKVTRMFKKRYPEYNGAEFHTKTLSVKVVANVDANLYFRGSMLGSIKAGERRTFTTDSWIKGQYELVLKDKKSGRVLDKETDKSKTNL